ncbi:MAG TPA: ferredoxin [Clostridiales bacterium]|nr:ferredoxin [Clostridiales bacterium]
MITNIIIPASIIGGMGLLFGLGLAVVSKKFAVASNDERIEEIIDVLPGANCAACGYSGCVAYATAVVNEGAKTNLCSVGKEAVTKKISEIMGVNAESTEKLTARVMCAGFEGITTHKYEYEGVSSCIAASQLHAGHSACRYGCLGFGDCAAVCPLNAIQITRGIAMVIEPICAGCGLCAETCPKKIIKMMPAHNITSVTCSNGDKGVAVRHICSHGCIGCTRCVKVCEYGAITMSGSLAVIDPYKCQNCGKCVEVCPEHTIETITFAPCDRKEA